MYVFVSKIQKPNWFYHLLKEANISNTKTQKRNISFGKGSLFNNCFITRLSHAVTKQLEISKRILLFKKKKRKAHSYINTLQYFIGALLGPGQTTPNKTQPQVASSPLGTKPCAKMRPLNEDTKPGRVGAIDNAQRCQPDSEEGAQAVFSGTLYLNYRSIIQCNRSSKENN